MVGYEKFGQGAVVMANSGFSFMLIKEVLDKADITHIHDEWMKIKLDSGKYKSSDIYPSPHDPALKKEYEEYLKKRLGK